MDETIPIDRSTLLIIEDKHVLTNLIFDFHNFDQSNISLYSDNFVSIKKSEIIIITDILNFSFNSNSTIKHIHNDLLDILNEDLGTKIKFEKVASEIGKLLFKLCLEHPLALEYNDLLIHDLLKVSKVRIEQQATSVLEQIYYILDFFQFLKKKKILIFINSCSYFNRDELEKIFEYINLLDIDVLFIEPQIVFDFPQYVLDSDFILFSKNMV